MCTICVSRGMGYSAGAQQPSHGIHGYRFLTVLLNGQPYQNIHTSLYLSLITINK